MKYYDIKTNAVNGSYYQKLVYAESLTDAIIQVINLKGFKDAEKITIKEIKD